VRLIKRAEARRRARERDRSETTRKRTMVRSGEAVMRVM
jgi:hypothetical protein